MIYILWGGKSLAIITMKKHIYIVMIANDFPPHNIAFRKPEDKCLIAPHVARLYKLHVLR